MNKRFYLPAMVILLFVLFIQSAFAAGAPAIRLNNSPLAAGAYIEEGDLYLPVRAVCEALGYKVGWLQGEQTVVISSIDKTISLNFQESRVQAGDHDYYMTDSPMTIDNRKYMKADFFAEHFSLKAELQAPQGTVVLESIDDQAADIQTIKESSEEEGLTITIQYPQLAGLENKQVQEKYNALFKELAKNAADTGRSNAEELAGYKEQYGGNPNGCETYFNYQVTYNQNGIISIVFQDYQYAGGAHGLTLQTSCTVDLKTGDLYALKDLFKDNADYVSVISSSVSQELRERDLTDALFAPFEKISEDQSYFLSNNGVVVYFQQYEILPYAAGIQEFPVGFSSLSGLLKVPEAAE